jgi:hypothetical protein
MTFTDPVTLREWKIDASLTIDVRLVLDPSHARVLAERVERLVDEVEALRAELAGRGLDYTLGGNQI